MSDRKYRQRGYQDDGRERERAQGPRPQPKPPGAPRTVLNREPRALNMPGFREVLKCARCGNVITAGVAADTRCSRCGADLHACVNCFSFNPAARWECSVSDRLPARVAPKDARNECALFEPRKTVERETHSEQASQGSAGSSSARKAFDDLFK